MEAIQRHWVDRWRRCVAYSSGATDRLSFSFLLSLSSAPLCSPLLLLSLSTLCCCIHIYHMIRDTSPEVLRTVSFVPRGEVTRGRGGGGLHRRAPDRISPRLSVGNCCCVCPHSHTSVLAAAAAGLAGEKRHARSQHGGVVQQHKSRRDRGPGNVG